MSAVEVLSEPRTYYAELVKDKRSRNGFRAVSAPGAPSYLQDMWMFRRHGDEEARRRLERHGREVEVEREVNERRMAPSASYEFEERAPTSSYADPPAWIIREFASFPRAGRPFADLIPSFDLPDGAMSVNVPRLTTGTLVRASQAGQPVPSRDITDAAASSPIIPFAGNADVPIQMLEQSPQGAHLDWLLFSDMEESYNLGLEQQLIAGTGPANGQILGLLYSLPTTYTNNPNIVYTPSGQPSATAMFTALGQVMAAVGRNRKMPPEVWLMPTPRIAWVASSEDNQSRPLLLANTGAAGEFTLLTVPVVPDDAIQPVYSSASNAAGGEERIIACRPSDWILLESDRRTDVMEDVLSGTLEVRMQMRRYAAGLARTNTGIATLSGSGMIPVGWGTGTGF